MKFYGREKELEIMERLYRSDGAFMVISGRRRVGKTELIKEFIKNRKAVYFYVDANKSMLLLLEEYTEILRENMDLPEYVRFDSIGELLKFIFRECRGWTVVFDEFQRFHSLDTVIISEFQKYIDLHGNGSGVFLIVSGSSAGMLKKIFIEEKAPLFKRADLMMNIRPFAIKEICGILEDMGIAGIEEKLNVYTLFGGTIYHYRLMERFGAKSFEECLDLLILNEFAPLANEVRNTLIEAFGREHTTYHEILAAMARGKSTKNDIGNSTHVSPTSLHSYFYDLMEMIHLVEHRVPVTEDPRRSKKGRYFLSDNFFRFYFHFIYRNISMYQSGNYSGLKEKIHKQWSGFRGKVFEKEARHYFAAHYSDEYPEAGSFWNRRGDEIDIVGINKKEEEMMLMEAKARDLTLQEAMAITGALEDKANLVTYKAKNIRYGIAAIKVGDREELERRGIAVIELDDIAGPDAGGIK